MEVRKPHIKSIPYEEWNDNASLEKIVDELHEGGVNVVTGSLDQLINWGRSNSLWSLTFATSCCGIEFMACGCARYDFARFGFEVTRNSPRQADLIMCAGTITHKMAPALKRLYDEMAEPKYVIAVGGCAISGGPFKSSRSEEHKICRKYQAGPQDEVKMLKCGYWVNLLLILLGKIK